MPIDAGRVSQMLADLEAEVSERASVTADGQDSAPTRTVTVTPNNPNARAMGWSYLGDDEVVVEVGDFGGRWEFTRSLTDNHVHGRPRTKRVGWSGW